MPTKKTSQRKPAPVPSRLSSEFGTMTLPADVWRGLFLVTLNRLKRARPAWADFTADQVRDFYYSHVFCYSLKDTPTERRWIADALKEMEACSLPDGRGRKKPDVHPSRHLPRYTQLKRYFDEHPTWTEGTDDDIREHLRRLLNELGPAGVRAKISKPLVAHARQYSPADLAREILFIVYGVDPKYQEKVFSAFRKSASVLKEWEREFTIPPLLT
jgi:hypothetical protein